MVDRKNIGGLETIMIGSCDRLLVCLLHGFGAPGDDLVSLVGVGDLPDGIGFAFPAAPIELEGSPMGGRAWWMLSSQQLQRIGMGDASADDFANEKPEGLDSAREHVLRWLAALQTQFGNVPLSRIVLGGFSQGAALSVDVSLHLPEPPAALTLFSGALFNQTEWQAAAKQANGCHRFQSHGRVDPILPFEAGQRLDKFLSDAGYEGQLTEFGGGHEIPLIVLQGWVKFLHGLVA